MKKLILILICLTVLFSSCLNDSNKNKNAIADTIISFSITSKDPELTSKSGKEVTLNEMKTIMIKSGDNILFKNFNFTLDNKIKGALNFSSYNGILIFNTPIKLSIMSMPPNGNGLTTYHKGDNIEISGTTLIKVNSTNFVISNLKTK